MDEIMIKKQNTLTNYWLCYIPETPIAYFFAGKKEAQRFCEAINKAIFDGKLIFDGYSLKSINK